DHAGDGGPGLLRIPAPPAAPGVLSPDGAGDGAEGPDGKADQDGPVGQTVQRLERGQPAADRGTGGGGNAAQASIFNQVEGGEHEAGDQDPGGRHDAGYVNLEPVGLQS